MKRLVSGQPPDLIRLIVPAGRANERADQRFQRPRLLAEVRDLAMGLSRLQLSLESLRDVSTLKDERRGNSSLSQRRDELEAGKWWHVHVGQDHVTLCGVNLPPHLLQRLAPDMNGFDFESSDPKEAFDALEDFGIVVNNQYFDLDIPPDQEVTQTNEYSTKSPFCQ